MSRLGRRLAEEQVRRRHDEEGAPQEETTATVEEETVQYSETVQHMEVELEEELRAAYEERQVPRASTEEPESPLEDISTKEDWTSMINLEAGNTPPPSPRQDLVPSQPSSPLIAQPTEVSEPSSAPVEQSPPRPEIAEEAQEEGRREADLPMLARDEQIKDWRNRMI
ncbi:hypothetical protein GOP47_0024010 [Adiantum capillus-veneris]|uniref:Uncharacterized protein n=1 Tax=Adiantum capillus-veneris TaxID=13818 RepID=A0A9D4U543_ADICA|nr:hypothetical protein GOP47_0024010 [Adiantum capillus-veneris]